MLYIFNKMEAKKNNTKITMFVMSIRYREEKNPFLSIFFRLLFCCTGISFI